MIWTCGNTSRMCSTSCLPVARTASRCCPGIGPRTIPTPSATTESANDNNAPPPNRPNAPTAARNSDDAERRPLSQPRLALRFYWALTTLSAKSATGWLTAARLVGLPHTMLYGTIVTRRQEIRLHPVRIRRCRKLESALQSRDLLPVLPKFARLAESPTVLLLDKKRQDKRAVPLRNSHRQSSVESLQLIVRARS